jgi:hypothetical protein
MIGQLFAHVTPGMSEIRDTVVSYFRTNNKNLHIPAKQLCSPSLQRILTVLKPGTMPSFLHLYEGGHHISFKINNIKNII